MSQSDVRTFKAASMQEALQLVRNELGPDAVILHTRELPVPRLFAWRKSAERVEITAGTGVNVRPPRGLQPSPTPRLQTRASAASVPANTDTGRRPLAATTPRHANDEYLATPPALLPPAIPPTQRSAPSSQTPASPFSGTNLEQGPSGLRGGMARPVEQADHVRPFAAPDRASEVDPAATAAPQVRGTAPRPESPAVGESALAMTRQLESIQRMVERLTVKASRRGEEIPGELFQLYTGLIDGEVDEDLARDLVCRLKQECTTEELADTAGCRQRLLRMVERELSCAAGIQITPGRRRVVALVGPTGVGKTTTIAKLAANFRLRDKVRMGLVTVDTYRIAAVEQLRTYAEIIDLPMKVVTGPLEMRRALDELSGLDLVLVDTAGRSPRDELKIQELKSLFTIAQVDEVHLVLSLAASPRSLATTAENFAAAGCTAVILTKLDEAVGMGVLISAARGIRLPISYLTTGQDVPDDMERAEAGRIARLVLGEETLHAPRPRAAA